HPKAPRLDAWAYPTPSASPKDAPVVNFGGQLRMRLSFATCDDARAILCARIGTPGLGEDTFLDCSMEILKLTKARPVVELEYPGEKGGMVRERATLSYDL